MSQLLEQFYGINVTPESDVTSTLPDIDKEELQQEYKKQYEKEKTSYT